MTTPQDTAADATALGDTLSTVQDKTRALNESLKDLSQDGFEKLTAVLARAATGGKALPTQKPAGEIVSTAATKMAQQEISSLLQNIIGGNRAATSGSGGLNVVINNNAGVAVTAQQTTDLFNQKQLEITIDQMVASAMVSGKQTTGVMSALFGIVPGLLGR